MSVIGFDTSNYTTSIAFFNGTDGVNPPFADGEIGQRLAELVQRNHKVCDDQLNDQHEGQYGHGRHGGMHDT